LLSNSGVNIPSAIFKVSNLELLDFFVSVGFVVVLLLFGFVVVFPLFDGFSGCSGFGAETGSFTVIFVEAETSTY